MRLGRTINLAALDGHGACWGAMAWLRAFVRDTGARTWAAAYAACPRGEWLVWWLHHEARVDMSDMRDVVTQLGYPENAYMVLDATADQSAQLATLLKQAYRWDGRRRA